MARYDTALKRLKHSKDNRSWYLRQPADKRAKICERNRWHARLKRYGITEAQFNSLAESQGWRCPITGGTITSSSHIDHCHMTGRIRGLLSPRGNKLLGHAKDRVELLKAAISYLEQDRLKPTAVKKCQADPHPHQPPV